MTKATATDKQKTNVSLPSLRNWNLWLAFINVIQGAAILLLSATKQLPVNTNYLTLDPSASELAGHDVVGVAVRHLFDVNLAYLVALYFFVAAVAHALLATYLRQSYEADLKKKVNKARWVQYAVSNGLMMVAIAALSGAADLSVLLAVFGFGIVANVACLLSETYNQGKNKLSWLAFSVGAFAGLAPWAIIAVYIWAANLYGHSGIPGFMYLVYLSMFVLFAGFAVNMYLQFKKVGQWKDYLYAERMYMVLSLATGTFLAWQLFVGALQP